MISAPAFRARAAGLLSQLEATDEGQAVAYTVAWARRQIDAERRGFVDAEGFCHRPGCEPCNCEDRAGRWWCPVHGTVRT